MSGRIQKSLCAALVCRGGDDGALSVDQMTEFINNKQRDPRLNEILYPPLRPAQTHTLMERYQHDKTQLEQGKQTIPARTYFPAFRYMQIFFYLSETILMKISLFFCCHYSCNYFFECVCQKPSSEELFFLGVWASNSILAKIISLEQCWLWRLRNLFFFFSVKCFQSGSVTF